MFNLRKKALKVFNKENIGVCIVGKDVENISL